MTEIWRLDENWCRNNGKMQFYVGDINSISREKELAVVLVVKLTTITVNFSEEFDRDTAFHTFCKTHSDYHGSIINAGKKIRALNEAAVEIQNRLAGHMIHEH